MPTLVNGNVFLACRTVRWCTPTNERWFPCILYCHIWRRSDVSNESTASLRAILPHMHIWRRSDVAKVMNNRFLAYHTGACRNKVTHFH